MRSTGGLDGQEGKRTFLRLLPLFFASGAAGLLYEVVWLRMLIRAFGVTVYAVTTVLAVFMGGLALGAFLGGRLAPRLRRPLLAYGLVEAGIGLSAWASTLAMRTLPELVPAIHAAAPSLPLAPVRFVLAALVLLVPTVLMGATLPVLSGLFEGRDGERRVGFLYAVNTGGAVLGVLASGFVLLGALGETRTVLAGVAANLGVGVAALLLCRRGGPAPASPVPAPSQSVPSPVDGGPSATGLLVLYGLVGAVALGYQVVWSRLLILLVGNSVYGFSSMLAMYLVGIAAGAAVMAARLRRVRDPVPWMAGLLALGAFLSVVSLAVLTALGTAETSEAYTYSRLWSREDFLPLPLYSFVVVFPVTFCSGALFPAFVQAWTRSRPGLPEATGRLYGVNTVGAIAGSVVTGFLLIGLLGSVLTLLVAAALSLVLATVVLLRAAHDHPRRRLAALGLWPAFLLLAVFSLEDPLPAILRARLPEGSEIRFHTEDAVAATTVADTSHRNLYINGLAVSGTGYIARVFYAFVPAAFHPAPERFLALGLGTGNALRGSLQLGLDTTIAELVPGVVKALPLTQPDAEDLAADPRLHLEMNDGRNFLLLTDRRFDVIVVDASPPLFSSGTVNLYSLEFVRLAAERLREDGILAIWVPLPCFESDFWQIARNFTEVFPRVMVWQHPDSDVGVHIFGSAGEGVLFDAPAERLGERIRRMGLGERDTRYLEQWVPGGRLMSDAEVRQGSAGYPPVTDDQPGTEFPLFRFLRGETYHRTNAFLQGARRPAAVP